MLYYPISRSGRFDIEPIPLQSKTVGSTVSLNLTSFLTAAAPAVSWSITGGSLPPGLTLSAAGLVSGTVAGAGGSTVAMVEANAGVLGVASQAIAFSMPQTVVSADREAIFTGGVVRTWSNDSAVPMIASDLLVSGTFPVTRSGWGNLTGTASGGGGGNVNNLNGSSPGGGGAGQFLDRRFWFEVGIYTVTIGASASGGNHGNTTTIVGPAGFSVTLAGGARGAGAYEPGIAGASGSGGAWNSSALPGGAATSIETGNNGGNGHTSRQGGGGGGFSAPGENGTATGGGSGGGGVRKKLWEWLNFGGGGGGGSNTGHSAPGGNGGGFGGANNSNGGAAAANTGAGGGAAGNRPNGSAVLVGGNSGSGRMILWARQQ